jgi:hypothetical protein
LCCAARSSLAIVELLLMVLSSLSCDAERQVEEQRETKAEPKARSNRTHLSSWIVLNDLPFAMLSVRSQRVFEKGKDQEVMVEGFVSGVLEGMKLGSRFAFGCIVLCAGSRFQHTLTLLGWLLW